MQRLRFQRLTSIPTLPHVSNDTRLCYPNVTKPPDHSLFTVCDIEIFPKIEARPSTITAPNYAQVSDILFSNVHAALLGKVTPEKAVHDISCGIHGVMRTSKNNYPKSCPSNHFFYSIFPTRDNRKKILNYELVWFSTNRYSPFSLVLSIYHRV